MTKKYSIEFKQTIVNLYQSGISVSQLVEEYGLVSQTIYR